MITELKLRAVIKALTGEYPTKLQLYEEGDEVTATVNGSEELRGTLVRWCLINKLNMRQTRYSVQFLVGRRKIWQLYEATQ